jgi:chorismate mutase
LAKSAIAERRTEPGPGIQDALTALDAATKTARAECADLAKERTRLTQEIAALKAERDEEQRALTALQSLRTQEFLKRCVAAGIDKHTIDELRAQLQSAIAEMDEDLTKIKEKMERV